MARINNNQTSGNEWTPWQFGMAACAVNTGLTYIHESGHAFAASLMYRNANPKITVFPGGGGRCSYNPSRLRNLGGWFRSESSRKALVASAGPIADILSLLAITKLSSSDQKVAELLAGKAIGLSGYALSGLWHRNLPGHDFCELKTKGGWLAYSLLAGGCFATTAVVLRNAASSIDSFAIFASAALAIHELSVLNKESKNQSFN